MRDGWIETSLGDVCHLPKGTTPTLKAVPGPYPLVVTAEARLTSDSYQFEEPAVCVTMVSSTGHGHASLKRVHYEEGQFGVANIIGLTPFCRSSHCESCPVARGFGQGDWTDHDKQKEASHAGAGGS